LARRPGRVVSVRDIEDGGMRRALSVSLRRKGPAFTHFRYQVQPLRRKVTNAIESVCLHDHRLRTTFCLRT
jgi:hypothetical protein